MICEKNSYVYKLLFQFFFESDIFEKMEVSLLSSLFAIIIKAPFILLLLSLIVFIYNKFKQIISNWIVDRLIKNSINSQKFSFISNFKYDLCKFSIKKRCVSLKNCCVDIFNFQVFFRKIDIYFSLNLQNNELKNSSNLENDQKSQEINQFLLRKKISMHDFTIKPLISKNASKRSNIFESISKFVDFSNRHITCSSIKDVNGEKAAKICFTVSYKYNEYLPKQILDDLNISEISIHSFSFESSKDFQMDNEDKLILLTINDIKLNCKEQVAFMNFNNINLFSHNQEIFLSQKHAHQTILLTTEYLILNFKSSQNRKNNEFEANFSIGDSLFPVENIEFSNIINQIKPLFSISSPNITSNIPKRRSSIKKKTNDSSEKVLEENNTQSKKSKHIVKIKKKNHENAKEGIFDKNILKTDKNDTKSNKRKRSVCFSEENLKLFFDKSDANENSNPNINENDNENIMKSSPKSSSAPSTPINQKSNSSESSTIKPTSNLSLTPNSKSISDSNSKASENVVSNSTSTVDPVSPIISKVASAPAIMELPINPNNSNSQEINQSIIPQENNDGSIDQLPVPPPPPPPPPPPAPLISKYNSFPIEKNNMTKTRSIFWKKVGRASLDGTIWQSISTSGIENDFTLNSSELTNFTQIFAQKGSSSLSINNSNSPSQSTSSIVQIINAQKAKATAILLSGLKMPPESVLKRVFELDFMSFSESQLQMMLKNAPDNEDYVALDAYKGDKRKLGLCEKYFLAIRDFNKSIESHPTFSANNESLFYKARIMLMLSMLTAKCTMRSLCEKFQMILDALYDVRESSTLMRVLACILSLGNILNYGTARGGALGFDLSILPKLIDTRSSSVPNYSLLNYVAETLAKKDEETESNEDHEEGDAPLSYIEKLRCEMPNVMMCEKIDLYSLQEAYKDAAKQFTNLAETMKKVETKVNELRNSKTTIKSPGRNARRRTSLNPFLLSSVAQKQSNKNSKEIPSFDDEMMIILLIKKFKKHENSILPISQKIQDLIKLIDEEFVKTITSFTGEKEIDKETTVVSFISTMRNFVIQLEKVDDENKMKKKKEEKKLNVQSKEQTIKTVENKTERSKSPLNSIRMKKKKCQTVQPVDKNFENFNANEDKVKFTKNDMESNEKIEKKSSIAKKFIKLNKERTQSVKRVLPQPSIQRQKQSQIPIMKEKGFSKRNLENNSSMINIIQKSSSRRASEGPSKRQVKFDNL